MSWEEIKSPSKAKAPPSPCTLTARVLGSGRATLMLIVREGPAFFQLGSMVKASIGRGEHAGMLRIVPDGETKVSVTAGPAASKKYPRISLPAWMKVTEKKQLAPCDYSFDDLSITVTLPSWATDKKPSPPVNPTKAESKPAQTAAAKRQTDPSVAAIELADHARNAKATPIDLAAALKWGTRNGLKASGDATKDFRKVNELRCKNNLPPYELIVPRGPLEELPEPTVGGH